MATELQDQKTITDLYKTDFYAWTKNQAAALRDFQASRPNLPLDLEHLIEEVEDLGDNALATVESQLQRVLIHYLKLEYSPARPPRRKWQISIIDAQGAIDRRLTRSMRPVLVGQMDRLYRVARRIAKGEIIDHDEPVAAAALPECCPYTLDQLLDETWRPTNRHGLVDEPF